MKHLKLFEGFTTPIIHNSENKLPFDRLSGDDILTNFIEKIDSGEWKLNIKYDINDELSLKQKMGHLKTIIRNVRTVNLFNRDNLNPDADFIFALIEINHPKDRVKSTMFDFDNYIKQVMIQRFKRFYNNWDVNIFMGVINISWMDDPMYKLFIVIQDNKHDSRYNQKIDVGGRIHESCDEELEVVKDYFMELDSHKNDMLPIKVSVERHNVNTKRGEINRKFSEKEKFKVNGFKIIILFDKYDQRYVKNSTDLAIKRLKRDYNIHYNQISKIGNGYNQKEIPVHGTNRVAYISDPIWKQTITITPKKTNESFLEDIDDVIEISIEKDDSLTFNAQYNIKFDLLRKEVVGEGDYYTRYSKNKLISVYGDLSSDFLARYETIVDAKQIFIDSTKQLTKELVEKIFSRLIRLYPSTMIFTRFIIQHIKDNGILYNRYEVILVNTNDYIKEAHRFLSRIPDFVDSVKDIVDIELGEKSVEYGETVFDVRTTTDLYTSGRYRLIYGPNINDYKKRYDIIDSLSINIYGELKKYYRVDDNILKLFRRLIKDYPNILIYKSDQIVDVMSGRSSDLAPLRIIIVNNEVYNEIH